MNNFRVEIKEWLSLEKANEGVNEYIEHLNNEGIEILEVTSHIVGTRGLAKYAFVFKLG